MHQIASQRIFISKNFHGAMLPDPPQEAWAFGHLGVHGKSQVEPWWVAKMTEARDGDSSLACPLCMSRSSLRPYYFYVPSTKATQKSPMVKNQHNTDSISNEDQNGFKMYGGRYRHKTNNRWQNVYKLNKKHPNLINIMST